MENIQPEFNMEKLFEREYTTEAFCSLVMEHYAEYKYAVHRIDEMAHISEYLLLKAEENQQRCISTVRESIFNLSEADIKAGSYSLICNIPFELVERDIYFSEIMTLVLIKQSNNFNIESKFMLPEKDISPSTEHYVQPQVTKEILQKVLPVMLRARPVKNKNWV